MSKFNIKSKFNYHEEENSAQNEEGTKIVRGRNAANN